MRLSFQVNPGMLKTVYTVIMEILLRILESTILVGLLYMLLHGLSVADLKLIVPATVVLLTLGPLILFNPARQQAMERELARYRDGG